MIERKLELMIINIGFIADTLLDSFERHKIKKYIKEKILYSKNVILLGKIIKVYYPSDKYSNLLREQGYFLYRSKVDQINHDYLLCKIFLSLGEKEREKWLNETYLKNKFKEEETTDAIVIKDGDLIAVEVITPSYTKDKIKNKKDFINNYCDDSIVINTKGLKVY